MFIRPVRASRMIRDEVLSSIVPEIDNDEPSCMLLLFRSCHETGPPEMSCEHFPFSTTARLPYAIDT